jgi:predicted outer membrane protein
MIDSNDPNWQAFLAAANDYIEIIDNGAGSDLVETCADLHSSLLELQLAALDLPETAADNEDPAMVTEAKRADRAKLKTEFDVRYVMSEQVLVIPVSSQPAEIREVSEDLADIYDALQDIIALNDQRYTDDAVSQTRNGYVEDWGYLVVSVQAALWKFVAEATIDAEEST